MREIANSNPEHFLSIEERQKIYRLQLLLETLLRLYDSEQQREFRNCDERWFPDCYKLLGDIKEAQENIQNRLSLPPGLEMEELERRVQDLEKRLKHSKQEQS